MIKKIILGIAAVSLLWSCDNKEKAHLQSQVDSLRTELKTSQQMTKTMEEVGTLIDSIDVNRQLLRTDMVEGTTYTDYAKRLRDINAYVRETQSKLNDMEKNLQKSKSSSSGYLATIKKLKLDLESRTQELAALQQEVDKIRNENQSLTMTVNRKDSALTAHSDIIKL